MKGENGYAFGRPDSYTNKILKQTKLHTMKTFALAIIAGLAYADDAPDDAAIAATIAAAEDMAKSDSADGGEWTEMGGWCNDYECCTEYSNGDEWKVWCERQPVKAKDLIDDAVRDISRKVEDVISGEAAGDIERDMKREWERFVEDAECWWSHRQPVGPECRKDR